MKAAAFLLVVLAAFGAHAAPRPTDPDWPCQQVKVADVSVAALWSGPPIEAYRKTWQQDPLVATWVGELSPRRVPMEQATTRIEAIAKQEGAEKRAKLVALFAGLFDTLDSERASVVAGLSRFGKRQKELAANLRGEEEALRAAQSSATPDDAKVTELTQRLAWDAEVFESRRQSLSFACDVPNAIEQRMFALARVIQPLLN
ncbi:MAG: hypothetical protein ABI369_15590 [Acetobacteraceae bacterium]